MKIYPVFKRIFDILFSITVIVFLIPVFILEYIIVKIFISKKAFFVQPRGGRNEVEIKVYKFKTMKDGFDKNGNLLPDHLRMSKVGNILRKTSIDEIPQFFNVLKGDMSVIGPRPQPIEMIKALPPKFKPRSLVRPGITGLAQVNGRNDLKFSEKYTYDLEYVNNYGFWMDFKIFFKTIYVVLSTKGSSVTTNVEDLDDLNIWSCYKVERKSDSIGSEKISAEK